MATNTKEITGVLDKLHSANKLVSLLDQLHEHGGIYAQAAKALKLCAAKTQDYHAGAKASDENADKMRDVYFPFGQLSYAQMLHVKVQRVISLVKKQSAGLSVLHESLADTYLDLVNYALFAAERAERDARNAADQKPKENK